MKRIGFAAACVFASLTCVASATAQNAPTETLSVAPYPAAAPWKVITNKHDDRQLLIEWIPADQAEDGIKDILTEQAFHADKQDAGAFASGFLQRVGGACRDARVNGPKLGIENGYPVAYAQAYCVGQKGADKDVDIFLKAIRGKDALYVVQREFRRPAEPGAMAGLRKFGKDDGAQAQAALAAQKVASDFLVSQVRLCAGGDTAICPPGPAAATAAASPPADPNDVSSSFGIVAGKSTVGDVEAKFGPSSMPTHAGDGRHTDMYTFQGGIIAVFLFGKDDVLIRTIAYKHSE